MPELEAVTALRPFEPLKAAAVCMAWRPADSFLGTAPGSGLAEGPGSTAVDADAAAGESERQGRWLSSATRTKAPCTQHWWHKGFY